MAMEKKPVRFDCRRIFLGKVRPFQIASYRDKYGNIVDFRKIPLYTDKLNSEGNPVPDMAPGQDGKLIPVTWGQILDFGRRTSVVLHPVVHRDVIERIRNHPMVRSSKKTVGRNPVHAPVIEFEPEVQAKENFDSAMSSIKAVTALNELIDPANIETFEYICAILGITTGGRIGKITQLQRVATETPLKFLSLFASQETLELSSENWQKAVVELAIQAGIIPLNRTTGVWEFQGNSLGTDRSKIAGVHNSFIPMIKSRLDEDYFAPLKQEDGPGEMVSKKGKKVAT